MALIPLPQAAKYPDFFNTYIHEVAAEKVILTFLKTQADELVDLVKDVSEHKAEIPYAPGKWSLKELLVHMLDTERIMAFRALCFSRGETQPIPGFEEDDYARNSEGNSPALAAILEAYAVQRHSTLLLFRSFSEIMLARQGTANGKIYSVNAIIWMVAGHEKHHLQIIKERYLPQQKTEKAALV